MIGGRYAFRFLGNANSNGRPYLLAGVGLLRFERGKLDGVHHSAVMQLEDWPPSFTEGSQPGATEPAPNALVRPATFRLEGKYEQGADGVWQVSVTFKSVDMSPPQWLEGGFALVDAGAGDTLWLVSNLTRLLDPDGVKAPMDIPEMVSGEAVRLAQTQMSN